MTRSVAAQVFADEWPRLVATLVRDLGDLTLAEDCAQDAFVAAAERWGPGTVPDRPGAWLLTTARRKAIDQIRRTRRFEDRLPQLVAATSEVAGADGSASADVVGEADRARGLVDDQLALIFGCCHPSLATEAQVALTLRHVAGLSTAQIARSFLVPEATMAKRLVRAKKKISAAGIPFVVPAADELSSRLGAVLAVIYLVFNEGYAASESATLVRGDLCDEARWLARLVADLVPDDPEVLGLAALVCLSDARRPARVGVDGELVLLDDQDRSMWDSGLIADGDRLLERAIALRSPGPYQLQAAIASLHANAPSTAETDWAMVTAMYDRLLTMQPSPVVALNAAVASSMADGPEEGLRRVDAIGAGGVLDDYRYYHATRGDLLRRLGRSEDAVAAYERAAALTENTTEENYLRARLADLGRGGSSSA